MNEAAVQPCRSPGFSMIGLLMTLVCMVVLFAIGMSAMNRAVTGEGSAKEGTVRSMKDELGLYAIQQGLVAGAADNRGRYITPSVLSGSGDDRDDTTASLFSAMVMNQYAVPEQLISANEFSGYVEVDDDYDFRAYDPGAGVWWDPQFQADLAFLSNTSYAHMPLAGERFVKQWCSSLDSAVPVLGNRGPKDGIDDPESYTYGRNKRWGGHVAYGDGHVEFLHDFTLPRLFLKSGQPDNVFAMEEGPAGADAILSFTKKMTEKGPELQFD